MAIGYFPELLPDELFYSALARYNYDTGNTVYRNFSSTFFESQTARVDIEFINKLNPSAYRIITTRTNIDDIIHQHTMFDFYTAFIPQERRERAFQAMENMDTKLYRTLIPVPHTTNKRYLRYCPLCAIEDRSKFGFAYWHRSAQMIGVNICPEHHCFLYTTEIEISSKMTPSIVSAEVTIPMENGVIMCTEPKEIALAQYCFSVLRRGSVIVPENDINVYLQSRLVGTPYLSARKQVRDMQRLYNDLQEYCYGNDLPCFLILSQISLMFKGSRFNPAEICLLGQFLNIPVDELMQRHIPDGIMENTVDDEIHRLHNEGWNYAQIARKVNVGYDVVKLIDYGKYGTYHKPYTPPKKKGTLIDWEQLDADYLPRAKKIIDQMERIDTDVRPVEVSVTRVERLLGLPERRIAKMPQCLSYIRSHQCPHEEYVARVIEWGRGQLVREGKDVTINGLEKKTNVRREVIRRYL